MLGQRPRRIPFVLALLLLPGTTVFNPAYAQGVTAAWDVRKNMSDLVEHVRNVQTALGQLRPQDWISHMAAPESYSALVESARGEARQVSEAANSLAANSEALPVAVRAYFRMESLELKLQSLEEGVRRYQGSQLAESMARLVGDDARHRDWLRRHISDLAEVRDQEFQVMNREAQRCRDQILRQPPQPQPSTPKETKK